MKKSYHKILNYVVRLESKIAFYPTVIGLIGLFFAIFMYYIEGLDVSRYLQEKAPWLVINNVDTARSILTTFVAGLISIMVFSFSMVMILLNQASTNYSPRVLPSLIANRRHQFVLGNYLSCLLYCIFTLIAIEPTGNKYQLPGFSVLLAIIFMTGCLGAFIYFIHSISQGIQINNIMLAISNKAKGRLEAVLKNELKEDLQEPDSGQWNLCNSEVTGYLEDIDMDKIMEILSNKKSKAEIIIYKGQYVREGEPLLKIEKDLDVESLKEIKTAFQFSKSELVETNYVLAYKQLTEIAVKAMSPGINDPGTALNAIDYLTDLFLLRMGKQDVSVHYNKNKEPIVYVKIIAFKTILHFVMASLRTYCKNDVVVVRAIMEMLNDLLNCEKCIDITYKIAALKELNTLMADSKKAITNKKDLKNLKKRFKAIQGGHLASIA